MAPTTAIGFLLFAAALSIDHWQTGIARGLSRSLTTLLLLIALTSIMGYAYGAPALYLGIDGVTAMSMPTAVLFLALGLGAVWLHPHYGFPAMAHGTLDRRHPYSIAIANDHWCSPFL